MQARPRRRVGQVARTALVTGLMLIGLGTVGGLGYAMTLTGDFVAKIVAHKTYAKQPKPKVVKANAALDQYSTTTDATTTTATTTQETTTQATTTTATTTAAATTTTVATTTAPTTTAGTTTTSSGTVQVTAPSGTSGDTSVETKTGASATITWDKTTFPASVKVAVDPTPSASGITFSAGAQAVSIVATVAGGGSIHDLNTPLEVVFEDVGEKLVPAVSSDGKTFRALENIGGPPLAADSDDGYYRDGSTVHILTRHLTVFAVVTKADIDITESGKRVAKAGSGKFGDPTLNHAGAPKLKNVTASAPLDGLLPIRFSVDEQAKVVVSVKGTSSKLNLTVLKPGSASAKLKALGLKLGVTYTVQFVATDYDGHKATATAKVKVPGTQPPAGPPSVGKSTKFGPLGGTTIAHLPAGTAEAAVATSGDQVYVIGGRGGRSVLAGSSLASLHAIATLPSSVSAAGAVLIPAQGALYIVGGEHGAKPMNQMLRIDLSTHKVTVIGKFVEPIAETAVVEASGRNFLVGGWTGKKYASAVLEFAGPNDISIAARLPVGLRAAAVVELDGTIYVAGGEKRGGKLSNAVYAFKPGSHDVKRIATLPQGVAHGTLVARRGQLYLLGGQTVTRIDPKTGHTTNAGSLASPLSGASSVTFGGNVFVVDGANRAIYKLR